jgi:hypothetical protein
MAFLTIEASRAYTRDHSKTHLLLQIGPFSSGAMRREASRVSFLMCPFRVRVLIPD